MRHTWGLEVFSFVFFFGGGLLAACGGEGIGVARGGVEGGGVGDVLPLAQPGGGRGQYTTTQLIVSD